MCHDALTAATKAAQAEVFKPDAYRNDAEQEKKYVGFGHMLDPDGKKKCQNYALTRAISILEESRWYGFAASLQEILVEREAE